MQCSFESTSARYDDERFKKTIFECFKKFENLNNEDEAYKLSKHEFMNYVIELKKNKLFFYDLIYFLSKSELKVLKK